MASDEETASAPRVSAVVPTRDRAQRLRSLLESLAAQSLAAAEFEVIVVDDGSRDATGDTLAEVAPEAPFELLTVPGPCRGPAAARNAGWRRARAEVVAFTDDDCEADPAWLETGLGAVADEQTIVQGRTRPIDRERHIRGVRARTKHIDGPGPWYQTCNIFYPRVVLERLDGFDEMFTRPFGEDTDLAWRAIESGARTAFVPEALVHHAVERLSVAEYLRDGIRDPDEAIAFERHPGLRGEVARLGVFKSDHHALLPLAVLGGALARCRPGAAGLAFPYLVHAAARCRTAGAGPASIPLLAAHDALELATAARGALRHRVAFI